MKTENHILYCDQVSMWLISGGRFTIVLAHQCYTHRFIDFRHESLHHPRDHTTIYRKFNQCVLCCRVACKYFDAYGTWTRIVHVVGFWGGPCTLPEPHRYQATQQFVGNLTHTYFCLWVACKDFGVYGTRTCIIHVVGFEGGLCMLPEPLSHQAKQQFVGSLTYMYFSCGVAYK